MAKIYISDRYLNIEKQLETGKQGSPFSLAQARFKIQKEETEVITKVIINGQSVTVDFFPFYFAPFQYYSEDNQGISIKLYFKNKTESYEVYDNNSFFWDSFDREDLYDWTLKNEINKYYKDEDKFIKHITQINVSSKEAGDKVPYLINKADKLILALEMIKNNPDNILMEEHYLNSIENSVQIDKHAIDYFSKHPETWYKKPGRQAKPIKVLSRDTEVKYNVYSNQFVKMAINYFFLEIIQKEIKRLERLIEQRKKHLLFADMSDTNDEILQLYKKHSSIYNKLKKSCIDWITDPKFKGNNVKEISKSKQIIPNQVLLKHPYYKTVFSIWNRIKDRAQYDILDASFFRKDRDEIHIYRDYVIVGLITVFNSLKFRAENFSENIIQETFHYEKKEKKISWFKDNFSIKFKSKKDVDLFNYTIIISANNPKIEFINPSFELKICSDFAELKCRNILVVPMLPSFVNEDISEKEFNSRLNNFINSVKNNYKGYDNILIVHNSKIKNESWDWESYRELLRIENFRQVIDSNIVSQLKKNKKLGNVDSRVAIIRFLTNATKYPNDKKLLEQLVERGREAYKLAPFYSHILRRYILRILNEVTWNKIKLCPICMKPDKEFLEGKLSDSEKEIENWTKELYKKYKLKEGTIATLLKTKDNLEKNLRKITLPKKNKSSFQNEIRNSKILERENYFNFLEIFQNAKNSNKFCQCNNIIFKIQKCEKCHYEEYDYFWNKEHNFSRNESTLGRKIDIIEERFNLLCYNTRFEDWEVTDKPYNYFVCPKCGFGLINYNKKKEA